MEFTKDIYFNDNLTSGKTATITYSGELFKSGSESVNIVFGYDERWHYTTTLPMKKTENGFTAEIEIKDYDTFNFCFSNEHNIWDNNNNCNYISTIFDEIVEDEIDYGTDYSSSIDDIIEDILGNTVQNTIANNKEADSVDRILETITEETLPEIEALFNELFAPILDDEKESVTAIESPDFSTEESNTELIRLFNELFESDSSPEFFENLECEEVEDLVKQDNVQTIKEESFDLDILVSNLVEDVVLSNSVTPDIDNELSLFDDIKEDNEEETSLTVLESKNLLVSSRRLNNFYKFKKRIKLACYKLFIKLPKQLLSQLGFGNN